MRYKKRLENIVTYCIKWEDTIPINKSYNRRHFYVARLRRNSLNCLFVENFYRSKKKAERIAKKANQLAMNKAY